MSNMNLIEAIEILMDIKRHHGAELRLAAVTSDGIGHPVRRVYFNKNLQRVELIVDDTTVENRREA